MHSQMRLAPLSPCKLWSDALRWCKKAAMPTTETRPDQSLHEDMRWLANALGRVILRLEGQEVFNAVEELRTASRDRRKGAAGAKDRSSTASSRAQSWPESVRTRT